MEINVGVKSFKCQNWQLCQLLKYLIQFVSSFSKQFYIMFCHFCSFSFFNSLLHDSVKDYICISILYYKDVV